MQIVHYTTLHSTLFSNQRFESRGLVPMIRFSHGFVSYTLPSCQFSSLGSTKIWGKKWRFFSASAGAQTQWRRDWEDPCPVTSTRSSRKWRRSKESSKMLLITRKLILIFSPQKNTVVSRFNGLRYSGLCGFSGLFWLLGFASYVIWWKAIL